MDDSYLHLLRESVDEKYMKLFQSITHNTFQTNQINLNVYCPLSLLPYLLWKSLPEKMSQTVNISTVYALCCAAHGEWYGFIDNYNFSPHSALHEFFSKNAYNSYREIASEVLWDYYVDNSYEKRTAALIESQTRYSLQSYYKTRVIPFYFTKDILINNARGITTAVMLLFSSLYKPQDKQLQIVSTFLDHLQVSFSLIKHLYTWQTDISQGYISPVVSRLLSLSQEHWSSYGKHNIEILTDFFWNCVLDLMLIEVMYHLDQTTSLLENSPFVKQPLGLLLLIKSLLQAVKKLQKQQKTFTTNMNSHHDKKIILVVSPYI